MDGLVTTINNLETKFDKFRPKTPQEKLELRSLDSGPFNQKLSDFFQDKETCKFYMDARRCTVFIWYSISSRTIRFYCTEAYLLSEPYKIQCHYVNSSECYSRCFA